MKLSDYVAEFLAKQGIRHVFSIIGGASLHLIDSLGKTPGTSFVCPQHEQAGAMAADGYARVTGGLGAAVATSGPGATNLITGICCSYFDSVPVIYLTGQVASFRQKGDTGVRQIGFQETDIVDMCKPVTKYAVQIRQPGDIRYELEKACYIATDGRPGPVLVDIPDDFQRCDVKHEEMRSFVPQPTTVGRADLSQQIDKCLQMIAQAKRPVLIVGWGVRLAKADAEIIKFIERTQIPVLPTWAMTDLLPADHPQLVGTFGTHGTRYANFTVQNSDLVLAIGARLDTRETGGLTTFAREATKAVVDIDKAELDKFAKYGMTADLLIHAGAKEFLDLAVRKVAEMPPTDITEWKRRIVDWKTRYPICPPENYAQRDVNPYVFVERLSNELAANDVIFVDTGGAVAWMMQAMRMKPGQRMFHDFNNTAMGYALPASIGACMALDGRPVMCVVGDGSLQMNLQELSTVLRHNLPIKIFLLNNHGYSMVAQTQDQWLNSHYSATTVESGLSFPDFEKLALAYGYKTISIRRNDELAEKIAEVLRTSGPVFCNIEISPDHRVIPQTKYGRPIEDSEPLLERDEFLANMIVAPHPSSLT